MNTDHHEQLSTGAAAINDADDEFPTVRINPIAEGEITVGQSGEPTVWEREPLQEAVEQNSLVDPDRGVSELVEGTGGRNPHHPLDEQVPPKSKLAQISEWEYEDGVGPVAEVQLADEDIANRVELGLLDVSADLERQLGEFDEELGARPVESILSMPRVTVVDRGASPSASIEPARAEALGYNPRADARTEQNAQTSDERADTRVADPADDTNTMPDNDDLREQLSDAQSRVSDLEDTKEQLAEEKESLEEQLSDLEDEKDALESEKSDLEEEKEQLSPLKGVLAEAAAGDSPLTAEQLSERFTTSELIDAIGGDEEDDSSPVDVVREQLAESPSPRGEGGEDTPDNVDEEEAEQLAAGAMNVSDMRQADTEQLSNREYIQREYDVDPAEYGTSDALRAAMRNGGDA